VLAAGRHFVGAELSPAYHEIATRHLEEAAGA
jgi:DNA modification methylase